MKKKHALALILALFTLLATGCAAQKDGQTTIVTSFYPMYVLTLNVTDGVDGVTVQNMAEQNVGCLHDYQLQTRDMVALEGADALLEKEDRLPYFGGFVSNLPGEHDVRKANHMKAHPAKFYAYTGLGRKEEAEREKKLAAYWGAELAWLSIVEEDGGNLGYEGI